MKKQENIATCKRKATETNPETTQILVLVSKNVKSPIIILEDKKKSGINE